MDIKITSKPSTEANIFTTQKNSYKIVKTCCMYEPAKDFPSILYLKKREFLKAVKQVVWYTGTNAV